MHTSVILQIKEKLNQLSKSEKKVGEFILNHIVETASQNTSELAQNIGVSPATIVRFCRSVGVSGFPQLKVKLYAESSDIDAALYTDIRPNENPYEISKKLVLRFNQSIAQTAELLDSKQVTQFSDLVEKHEKIYIYGLGASYVAANDLTQKFLRLGKPVIHLQDTHLFASFLTNAGPDSLFIAVSNSGETNEVVKLTQIAKRSGLPTVGIVRDKNSTLGQLADLVIIHGGGEAVLLRSAATTSLISQLFVVNVLYYAYLCKHYETALVQLKKSKINIQSNFS